MEAKLNTAEVLNAADILAKRMSSKLPVKIGFAITKNIREIEDVLDSINKMKQVLFEKYAEDDDGQQLIKPETQAHEMFQKDWTDYLKEEHVFKVHKIRVELVDKAVDEGKMEPFTLQETMILSFMLEDLE